MELLGRFELPTSSLPKGTSTFCLLLRGEKVSKTAYFAVFFVSCGVAQVGKHLSSQTLNKH